MAATGQMSIQTEWIELGQAMKLAALVGSGGEAKTAIASGDVQVNGAVETRRGRKLHPGDTFTFMGTTIVISSISSRPGAASVEPGN